MYYQRDNFKTMVCDRYMETYDAHAHHSDWKPGTWFVVFRSHDGFHQHITQAVIDNFGNLVEVKQ